MATYPSNLILAGGGQATPSVVPGTNRPVVGTVTIPAGAIIAANDTMPLFNMSSGGTGHIVAYLLDSPALDTGALLTVSMLDSTTPTPTTFFAASTSFRAGAILTQATAARASLGAAVNYTASILIFLRAIAAATGAIPVGGAVIYFVFEITRD